MDRRRRAVRTAALMSLFAMTDFRENVPVDSFMGDGSNLVSLIVGIDPVQAGSGDPSPDNVRPISGWTEAKVTRTEKNLNPWEGVNFTADTHPGGFWLNAGDYVFSLDTGGAFGSGNNIYVKLKDRDGNVITSGNLSGSGWNLNSTGAYYYGGGNEITRAISFHLNTDCFFCFGFNNTRPTANGVQLEVGSTATAYEPYNGETYSITFPTEAGTVYGGTLDVTTGKLTVTHKELTFDGSSDEQWNVIGGSSRAYIAVSDIDTSTPNDEAGDIISNQYMARAYSASLADSITLRYGIAQINVFDIERIVSTVTIANWKDMLAANPLQVVYPLATPIVYDLTSTEINTLLGMNNVWSDTGDVTVTYAPTGVVQTATVANLFAAGDVKDEQDIISGVVTRRTEVSVSGGEITITALPTPITERVTAQPLRTAAGDNTVSVTSNVDPVDLSAEYATLAGD